MIHINPIDYPKLNKREIKLEPHNAPNIFKVTLNEGCRLFYGKKLTIFLGNQNFTGRYSYSFINEEKINLLIFEDAYPNITSETTCSIYETFVVPDDNQAITFQDLQEKFESHKSPVKITDASGIDDIGSNNIVDGFQTLKIDQSLYGFKTAANFELNNSVKQLASVKINPNKINQYKFFLYSEDKKILVNFELVITGNCDDYYIVNHTHINQSYSFENEQNQCVNGISIVENIKLSLVESIGTNDKFVSVNLQLTEKRTYILNGYIYARHPSDLWIPDESENIKAGNNLLLNNGESINIDSTLLFADKHGEQRTIIYGTTLGTTRIASGNTSITGLPVGYYTISKENAPFGIPGKEPSSNLVAKDLSEQYEYFKTLDWTFATLIVMPNNKYMLYTTNDRYVFIGSLFDIKDVKWSLLSIHGHTHTTDDLIIGSNNLFVTQEQIDTWNEAVGKINNLSWKTYLTDDKGNELTANIDASLNANKGNAAIKFDDNNTPIIYVFDGTEIVPVSIGVLTVESQKVKNPEKLGTLITQETLDRLSGLGIGYRINNKNQFILITNNSTSYVASDNQFFDLTYRGLTGIKPGNNSLNFGFSNDVANDDSIFIGTGLKSYNNQESNKIVIGKWNNPINGAIFEIGNGTDSINRKTIVWYTSETYEETNEEGDTITIEENLFNVDGNFFNGDSNQKGYILVNGKEPIINNFVTYDIFNPVKDTVDEIIDNSIFIKLIPLDTNLKPVIQRVLALDDYSEYNTYSVTLNITGGFGDEYNIQIVEGEKISSDWKLKEKYSLVYDIISNPDESGSEEEDDDENILPAELIQITDDELYFSDTGELTIILSKATILIITDYETNKTYKINMFDYITNIGVLSNQINVNVEDFLVV